MKTFYQALKEIERGETVRRISWDDKDVYCDLTDGILTIHNMNTEIESWVISIEDMTATDWVVVGEDEEW